MFAVAAVTETLTAQVLLAAIVVPLIPSELPPFVPLGLAPQPDADGLVVFIRLDG